VGVSEGSTEYIRNTFAPLQLGWKVGVELESRGRQRSSVLL
jgi:hypothetical protein